MFKHIGLLFILVKCISCEEAEVIEKLDAKEAVVAENTPPVPFFLSLSNNWEVSKV